MKVLENKEQLSVTMLPSLLRQLEEIRKDTGAPISFMVERAVKEYLAQRGSVSVTK